MLQYKDYGSDWPDISARNFSELLDDVGASNADRIFIYHRAGRQREFTKWTYAHFVSEAKRIARGLIAAGLQKGERVVLWSENRPEWMAVWMGCVIAGAAIVPLDFLISEDECVNLVSFTKARFFIFSHTKYAFAETLASRVADKLKIERIVAIGAEKVGGGIIDYKDFGADADNVALPSADSIAPSDPASIVFTSGTTGFAKGVTLSHGGIIANVNAATRMLRPRQVDVFINVLPLHHTYPTTCSFLAPFAMGIPTIIVDKLVGKIVIDDVREAGGTFMIAVPLLYDKVMAGINDSLKKLPVFVKVPLNMLRSKSLKEAKKGNPDWGRKALRFIRKKAGLDSIDIMVAGGGALNPATADFFDSLGFNIVQGYGMSENGPLISVSTPWHKNNVSVGLPVKHTEVRIADKDAAGHGEIQVRSPSLMLGYFENPEATAEAFTEDGWLKTGDLGYLDEDGFIYINGRQKNLIVTAGGKNIYPEELELHFAASRVIGEILIVGRKSKETGEERIFAVVYPNMERLESDYKGKRLNSEQINALVKKEIGNVNRKLPAYKKIADFMLTDKEFEKNAQRKIRRFLYKSYEVED
jgi:long-chain acyl-CoA synthetase